MADENYIGKQKMEKFVFQLMGVQDFVIMDNFVDEFLKKHVKLKYF
jgi:hypothetical protein